MNHDQPAHAQRVEIGGWRARSADGRLRELRGHDLAVMRSRCLYVHRTFLADLAIQDFELSKLFENLRIAAEDGPRGPLTEAPPKVSVFQRGSDQAHQTGASHRVVRPTDQRDSVVMAGRSSPATAHRQSAPMASGAARSDQSWIGRALLSTD
jgi:hypothetical protein